MPFQITITHDAESQLRSFPVREPRLLETAVTARLLHQPATPSNAIKKLRPNPLAQYELRVGSLRVLYNVEGTDVVLLVVGRKVGNKLVVKRQDFHEHQDNPSKPAGNGPSGDVE